MHPAHEHGIGLRQMHDPDPPTAFPAPGTWRGTARRPRAGRDRAFGDRFRRGNPSGDPPLARIVRSTHRRTWLWRHRGIAPPCELDEGSATNPPRGRFRGYGRRAGGGLDGDCRGHGDL